MLDSLRMLHSLGLHDGEIFRMRQAETTYEYSSDTLKVKNRGTEDGFGIRVLKDGRIGFSYANSNEKIPDAIRSASALSKFSVQSRFSFAQKQEYEKIEGYDQKVEQVEDEALKEMLYSIAAGIEKHSDVMRIILVSASGECEIANTDLLYANDRSTAFTAYAEAKNGKGFGFSEYSHYKLLENPEELGERAGIMAREMKNPGKLPAGKYSVIFSPEVLSSLFGLLSYSFSGELRRRKISRLWDKEGQQVFDEKLTVYDDPFADGTARTAFDGEGVKSKRIPLIEKGVVKNFYYNRETAALANIKKEGNCARAGYDSPPAVSASNTAIETGNSEPETELKKYVYIESMHGLHTANTTTGDFGAEVSIAFLHEKGNRKAVRGFMVSENIFNLFSKIECIGKEQIQAGDFISPKIAFRDISLIS